VACKQIPASDGINIVGVPIGAAVWVSSQVDETFEDIHEDLSLLKGFASNVDDRQGIHYHQAATNILVKAVHPRAVFTARVVNPATVGGLLSMAVSDGRCPPNIYHLDTHISAVIDTFRSFDKVFRDTAIYLRGLTASAGELSIDATSFASKLVALPFRRGGYQWRSLVNLAPVAHLAGGIAAARVAHRATTRKGTPLLKSLAQVPFAQESGLIASHAIVVKSVTEANLAKLPVLRRGLTGSARSTAQAARSEAVTNNTKDTAKDLSDSMAQELKERAGPRHRLQHALTSAVEEGAARRILAAASPIQKSIMQANTQRGGYEWAMATPTDTAMSLNNRDYDYASSSHLGLNIVKPNTACPRGCYRKDGSTRIMQLDGSHGFRCSKANKHFHHERGVKEVMAASVCAGAVSRKASSSDVAQPVGGHIVPDTCFVAPGLDGGNTDYSIVVAHDASILTRMATRVKLKNTLYKAGSAELGLTLVPFVQNSLGGLCNDALFHIKTLAKLAAGQATDSVMANNFMPYWVTRFSVHMQRVAGDAIARSLVAPTADEGKPGLPSSKVFASYLSYTDVMGAVTE
jgi:hypothetical protein